jgi:hypothetical protein
MSTTQLRSGRGKVGAFTPIKLQAVRQPSTITRCLKRASDAKNSPSARALMTVYLTRKELEALSAKNLNEETGAVRKKHPRHVEFLLGMI